MKIRSVSYKTLLATLAILSAIISTEASATITYVSGTNSVNLVTEIADGDAQVFVINGLADGQSTDLTFSIDSACPLIAMTGGAEFSGHWSCVDGVISLSTIYRGGMSFGPGTEENADSFYVTFSNPPTPPGVNVSLDAMAGIQISLFGDVNRWDLDGEFTSSGVAFGVELTGPQGGAAHFRMYLPPAAVEFLGGVIGLSVGGKPDPFATVTNNEDGSADLSIDIESLSNAAGSKKHVSSRATDVTKKITAGERVLGVSFNKSSIKTGKSVTLAMCSGPEFTSGAKVPVKFTVGGKDAGVKGSFTLNDFGCSKTTVKLKSVSKGTLTAKVSYNGDKAKSTLKVTK